ncbi:DUF1819 family protein [Nitrosomonas communis]|uniref:DUF1819 family protein n=1 Tax=Nitrosomonas communis TaxID=44574 RepID=UPI003D2E6C22
MNNIKYGVSYIAGGLFHHESLRLAALYLKAGDWNLVRDRVITENLLQTRTLSTSKRICREIISRLKALKFEELKLLVEANPQEQGYLLWLAVCRCYRLIGEFALEVLREKYINLKTDLSYEDFDSFFNKKSEWHAELDQIRSTTRKKMSQVLFRILHEADLLSTSNTINPALLSPRLLEVISHSNRQDVLFFPVFESDLKEMPQ